MEGIATLELQKRFGDNTVLHSFSFVAPPGEVTLVAGRNGAGKTTWVRLALGMARPSAGCILYDDQPVGLVRRKVAAVLDEPPVYPRLSGMENLRQLSGLSRPDSSAMADVINMLNLEPSFLKMRASEYSLGQRRRLSVAAALLRQPSYLFLDEPTIGLDPVAWAMVKEAIGRLKADGCTVVLTGQDFTEVESIVEQIVVLKHGEAAFCGTSREFLTRRPPRVRISTTDYEQLSRMFPTGAVTGSEVEPIFEVPCQDQAEAQAVMDTMLGLGIQLRGIAIVNDNLEQAFLSIAEDESDNSPRKWA